jgi:hypothetical protein
MEFSNEPAHRQSALPQESAALQPNVRAGAI